MKRKILIALIGWCCAVSLSAQDDNEETLEESEYAEFSGYDPYDDFVQTSDQRVRRARSGIIVVVGDSTVRAMEPYRANRSGLDDYARVMMKYHRTFPKAKIWCMPIPNAVAFYCPEEAREWTMDEGPVIEDFLSRLPAEIHPVNLMPVLSSHVGEAIYSRTDHHWQPLGAYYAAEELAWEAGVPFMPFTSYEPDTIRNYVGTMMKFSGDKAVGQYPELFIYYRPQDVEYKVVRTAYGYSTYRTGRGRRRKTHKTLTARQPENTDFFRYYPDGSGAAYSTFMGGDLNQTSIYTSTKNGRRLMILKDSYGNALPSCLFGSFEEIHVVDCRYFFGNMVNFVNEHKVTDILFCNNLIHASSPVTSQTLEKYLTQK